MDDFWTMDWADIGFLIATAIFIFLLLKTMGKI